MKKIYLLVVGCVVSASVFAQSSTGLKFGIKAGFNLATMASSQSIPAGVDKGSVTGFNIGGTVDVPVSSSFVIQPGLILGNKGVKVDESVEDYNVETKNNLMYLEVPVNALYKFQSFYFGAGPYAAFALGGKTKAEGKMTEDDVTVTVDGERDLEFGSDEENDDYKSTDFGLNILAGYELKNGVNLGVNYGLGLSNLVNYSGEKVRNRVFSVSVGFKF